MNLKSDLHALSDMVYAAMETGNHAQARRTLKEYEESFPKEVRSIRNDVLKDYGVRL